MSKIEDSSPNFALNIGECQEMHLENCKDWIPAAVIAQSYAVSLGEKEEVPLSTFKKLSQLFIRVEASQRAGRGPEMIFLDMEWMTGFCRGGRTNQELPWSSGWAEKNKWCH